MISNADNSKSIVDLLFYLISSVVSVMPKLYFHSLMLETHKVLETSFVLSL